ncbi:MAG: hypothetical protein Q8L45_06400 [Xanthomonadaceae bacterium]|nr:hypothetical protein [Xanthomonadaceae bacterium]MDP2186318.1 hypothetical protein [Xanthomonadales bacterium]MDZ4115739.1 hypothetical protein [Xanthomonadaceae bacterium]MDZ4379357.1 hypothetical protein [Xanthomonadaceae bacterium]
MDIKQRVLAAAVMAATLGLSGCSNLGWSAKAGCTGSGCSVEGEIHGGAQKLMARGAHDLRLGDTGPTVADLTMADIGDVAIDVSGSSVAVPFSGNITLKLVDSASGFVVASRTFAWSKVGQEIKLSDPSLVNIWIQDNGSGADDMQYALAPFPAAEVSGLNTFATSVTYAGEVQAASTYSWTGSGGGSCSNCQVK